MKAAALLLLCFILSFHAAEAQQVAQFIFGDSLVDSGNNDYILSIARANFFPNGIDTQNRVATGRFCNGLLISDFVSQFLGAQPVLPFLDPSARGRDLLRGSNFASAGAGIVADTGSIFLRRITMPEQIGLFQRYQSQVSSLIGPQATGRLIANSLVSVTVGGNDYINNYLLPGSARRAQLSPFQFNSLLVSTLRDQLQQISNLGARKIVVSNMGPIGCIPSQKSMRPPSGLCLPDLQQYAQHFNSLLRPMLSQLTQQNPGSVFLYSNGYDMLMDIMANGGSYGLSNVRDACCGQGAFNGNAICTGASTLCADRSSFLWWDPYHPTEAVNKIITDRLLDGPPSDISPMNLRQVLRL
ncbi:hypothetical protein SELMODRAFT_403122 [Selaginella moellendorffii]|uniref:Uncharacterized protein n=2 Tax=Selaginella moellendorffii TaxID=88036 RepID=D8QP46_SELML|nr:hypothetical protein SELMODRAFT_403122 [Selaginella moellendorffii]